MSNAFAGLFFGIINFAVGTVTMLQGGLDPSTSQSIRIQVISSARDFGEHVREQQKPQLLLMAACARWPQIHNPKQRHYKLMMSLFYINQV